ncbi:MAG: hypothetical protein AB7P20_07300 [Rhizobiaceae bacterium]
MTDYARHLFRPVTQPRSAIGKQARSILRQTLAARLDALPADVQADGVLDAFDRHPVIQAGVHSQLLFDRISFSAFLLSWLGAVEQRLSVFFVFTGATVTMETIGKEGPGWLDLGDRQINLFGMGRHKLCRQSVAGAGPVSLNHGALTDCAMPGVEVIAAQAGRRWGGAADAFADINGRLVSSWDRESSARPAFFDDRHASLAVAEHLENEASLVTGLLTDPARRYALEGRLNAASAGPLGRFLPLATAHFWGVRDKRVRKLIVTNDVLTEVDRPHGVRVPLERRALRDALLNGVLLPNLFVLFLVMSLLPRVRVLGGFRQIGYVPVFQSVLRDVLNPENADERLLLEDLSVHENAWGMRVIEEPQSVFEQIGAHTPGALLAELRRNYAGRSLADVTDGLRLLVESSRWRKLARAQTVQPTA